MRTYFLNKLLSILTILLLPLSVWAMTPISDADLSKVTGQAGVSINTDLTMNIDIDTLAWGDASGMDWCYGWDTNMNDAAGYFGFDGFRISNLHIRARTETNDTYGGYSLTDNTPGGNHLKPTTIDVATNSAMYNGATFVRLGLGSLQITMQDIEIPLALGPAGNNLNQMLGEIYFGDLNLYINANSYVDVYKSSITNSGVTLNSNVTIDKWSLTALSWGDADGLPNEILDGDNYHWMTSSGGGYIGLQNVTKSDVRFFGSVSIDVNTSTSGWYIEHAQDMFDAYLATGLGDPSTLERPTSVTSIRLTFGENSNPNSFIVFPLIDFPLVWAIFSHGEMTANVNLSPYKNLTSNPALGQSLGDTTTLGNIYMSNLDVSFHPGSWVDIWAH